MRAAPPRQPRQPPAAPAASGRGVGPTGPLPCPGCPGPGLGLPVGAHLPLALALAWAACQCQLHCQHASASGGCLSATATQCHWQCGSAALRPVPRSATGSASGSGRQWRSGRTAAGSRRPRQAAVTATHDSRRTDGAVRHCQCPVRHCQDTASVPLEVAVPLQVTSAGCHWHWQTGRFFWLSGYTSGAAVVPVDFLKWQLV
jgi:hypothetical protein